MKKLLLIISLGIIWLNTTAQDSAYYHTAFNSADDSLKSLLHNIIKGHTQFPYTSSSTDVWDILKQTDKDPNNPANVILIYSNRSVNAAQEFNNGNGWNREHVWPQSRGDFGTSPGPGTDVHHLRPCDISVNADRENRNFDECVNCVDIIDNGFNTGSKKDASLYTFEPPENVKGDIARMIFYMAVRYEGGTELDLELTNTLQSQSAKQPLHAVLNTLLSWNRMDTVDSFERNRNLVIYGYQGNKNPFIDYPELAEYLWGDSVGVVWKPEQIVIGLSESAEAEFKIYPNPSSDGQFKIQSKEIPIFINVYNSIGQKVHVIKVRENQVNLDLSDLQNGFYLIEVNSKGETERQRVVISR